MLPIDLQENWRAEGFVEIGAVAEEGVGDKINSGTYGGIVPVMPVEPKDNLPTSVSDPILAGMEPISSLDGRLMRVSPSDKEPSAIGNVPAISLDSIVVI